MKEENNIESNVQLNDDVATRTERWAVFGVYAFVVVYMAYLGNTEAMMVAASTIATYFMSRKGA